MATLSDLLTFGRDNYYDKVDTKSSRILERAANTGLRLIAQSFDWEYFNSIGRVNTSAQQSSGTVAITQSSATVTLTGGTWPTALTSYHIRIGSETVDHQFGTRTGNATGSFVSGQVWNGSTQTAATYLLYQTRYSLASDCRKFGELLTQNSDWNLQYLDRDSYERMKAGDISFSGDPVYVSHDNSYIYLWPPPSTRKAILYTYQRWPTEMTTTTDTADWDSNRIDLLYGAMGLAIDIHQKKIDWLGGIAAVRKLASIMASDEPKRDINAAVQSMYPMESARRGNRLEYGT